MYVSMAITCSKSMDPPGKVANPARGQLNEENEYFPVPVHAWEFGLARRLRHSRPASAPISILRLNLVLTYNRPSLCRCPDSHTYFFFFPLFFVYLEMPLFPSIFCTILAFSLYEEYVVRSFLPDDVFLPCDHGLDFWHQVMWEFNQSINQSTNQYGIAPDFRGGAHLFI